MRLRQRLGLALILVLTLSAFTCNNKTRNLAIASDAIAHALANAQQAARQGATEGVISVYDENQFEVLLSKTSQAGMVLNQAIRDNESASSVASKVSVFLKSFNELITTGVAGIKNAKLQISLAAILNGAQASIAVIAASVGGQ
jgi:hypothetical protein